jgi:hypothetical protein
MFGDYILKQSAWRQTGNVVGNVAIGTGVGFFAKSGTGGSAAFSTSTFVSAGFGQAVKAVNNLFDQVEAAGVDPSIFSSEALGSAALAGAAGLDLDYNSETGELTASTEVSRAGSRIKRKIEVTICKSGDDGKCK